MHVIGIRRSPRKPDDPADEVHTLAGLHSVLPRCDWVVLACPLTRETHHLINERSLAALPAGARIINIARGSVVDERALVAALRAGHIGGAYLDVFEQEPLPVDSPLWDMPNVIVTPHNAQASLGNDGRSADYFAQNLVRWARGEEMVNERHA
jgi:phosphoglycerate dehydrogenase-like enzyme